MIRLSQWKLQLPVNAEGKPTGKAAEIRPAVARAPYFIRAGLGAWDLMCPAEGARTPNTLTARTELRELNDKGANAAWTLGDGQHTLDVSLRIDALVERVVVGQIHAGSGLPMMLHLLADGTVFVTDSALGEPTRYDLAIKIPLGQRFHYRVTADRTAISVSIRAGGTSETIRYPTSPRWLAPGVVNYFKAGLYGRFYSIRVRHRPTPRA